MNYFSYKDEPQFEDLRYKGNLKPIYQVLSKILMWILMRGVSESILLFGYPGTGKSKIIESVLHGLMSTIKVDLVNINCNSLIANIPEVSSSLIELKSIVHQYTRNIPDLRVFVFDEIDAIGPERDRDGGSGMQALCHFCMDCIKLQIPHTLWIFITNYPRNLDPAILTHLGKRIYIPGPDTTATQAIIEKTLDPDDSLKLLNKIVTPSRDYVLNIRSITKGLEFLVELGKITSQKILCDIDEAVTLILAGGGFPHYREIDEYVKNNREFIKQAELLMRAYGL